MIARLNGEQAQALLRRGRIARRGCCADGASYVVPINYLFDGESILIHSLTGRKITAMRTNPRVCLQIDEIKDEFDWKSLLAFGTYEEINTRSWSYTINVLMSRQPFR